LQRPRQPNPIPESKRRLHNLLEVSGTLDALSRVRARPAPPEALARVHSAAHIDNIRKLSADSSKGCHRAGDALSFSPGAYEIACLAAGGAMALVDAVMGAPGGAEARYQSIRHGIRLMEDKEAVPEIIVLNPADAELFDLLRRRAQRRQSPDEPVERRVLIVRHQSFSFK
jgi:hypothetical protein